MWVEPGMEQLAISLHFTAQVRLPEPCPFQSAVVDKDDPQHVAILVVDLMIINRHVPHETLSEWNMRPSSAVLAAERFRVNLPGPVHLRCVRATRHASGLLP